MKGLRLLLLAAVLLGVAACSITAPTPTATPAIVTLPAGAAAAGQSSAPVRSPVAAAPAATATPAATRQPTPTWVLKAPLPDETPRLLATLFPRPSATPTPVAGSAQPAASRPAVSGRIVLQTSSGGSIVTVNADGTQATTLTSGLDPAWSPDGKQIAFTRWSEPQQGVYVMDADGGNMRLIYQINGAKNPIWSPDGTKIAFTSVYKQERRQPRFGDGPATVTDYWRISVVDVATGQKTDVMLDGDQQAFTPSWRRDGLFVYKGARGLFATTETGWPTALTSNPLHASPAWSPDGTKIVFMIEQHDHWDIAVINGDGGGLAYLTSTSPVIGTRPVNNVAPTWSPDGSMIAFLSDRDGDWRVYVMNANGSQQRTLLDVPIVYEYAAERVLSWTR